jgi:predicted nucleic-acid-binding Zn-ribbon protein
MSTGDRKCPRCGGAMEDGFLCSDNSVGEFGQITRVERCGWMAGDDFQSKKVGWLKVDVLTNQRRTLTASRCMSCGLTELYAR